MWETGETVKVKAPKVWMQCEYIFTSGYFNMDDNYIHYLLNPKEEQYPNVDNQPYKRVWTRPIQSYGTCYNEFDIAVAPLVNDEFNRMKSQLKVIEAGFHKKPLIASDVAPYQIDCVHGKNAMLVPEKKAHKLFSKFAKKLVTSEAMRDDLGEALYETVKDKYDLNKVTVKRANAYKSLF
jgi:glycosyltransferase involved in cell wall biosynthesis